MEVGLSTASYFNKMTVEDAVTDIGAHGVRVCEVFLNSFSEYEPAFVEMLARRARDGGVSVYSVHPMGIQFETLLFSQHDRQCADSLRVYERVLCAAETLGATRYVMHGAANLSGVPFAVDYARFADVFDTLLTMAERHGVTLTLENVSWCLFNRPEFGVRLSEALGNHRLKFTLDVKQALRVGLTALDFIDAVGEDVVNLHLCDAVVAADRSFSMRMPGAGDVDFAAIRDALMAKGYAGPAFIEVYGGMYREMGQLYHSLAQMRAIFSSI